MGAMLGSARSLRRSVSDPMLGGDTGVLRVRPRQAAPTRVRNRAAVQHLLREKVRENWRRTLCAFSALVVCFGMYLWYLMFCVLVAWTKHGTEPCDVPLTMYTKVAFLIGWSATFSREVVQKVSPSPGAYRFVTGLYLCVNWSWLLRGYYWIADSQTCAETNPHLFFAVRSWNRMQMCFSIMTFVLFAGFKAAAERMARRGLLGGRHSVESVTFLAGREAISRLPRVSLDDLPMEDDGEFPECSICMRRFNDTRRGFFRWTAPNVVVRTPCGHLFHKSCLSNWVRLGNCACPLCRGDLQHLCP